MSKLFKICFLCFISHIFSGCAVDIKYREYQEKISTNTKKGDFDEVKRVIDKKNFHTDEENYLLKNLEIGMYLFNTKNYCQAVDYFDEAYNTTKLQQSKDISSSIVSMFGAGLDIYYGKVYELSLLRFLSSLTNYNIYTNKQCDEYIKIKHSKIAKQNVGLQGKTLEDKEVRQKFSASKGNVIEWDSWLEGREIKKDDRYYSKSLLQKVWGAFIHEQQGTLADRQIALQLYKDAKDVALNRYAVYGEFNKNNQTYIDNLDKIESKKLYLDADNKYVKDINEFADKQIERVQNNNKANFNVVIFDDLISEKKAERVNIPSSQFFRNDSTLLYTSNVIGAYSVSFEVPYLRNKPIQNEYFYKITNKKTKKHIDGKVYLIEPISNIAYTDFSQTRNEIVASIVARIQSNFKSCIISVINSRKNSNRRGSAYSNNSLAGILMQASVNTAFDNLIPMIFTESNISLYSSAIRMSCYSILNDKQRVDVRQWVSLPSNIFITTDRLEDGEYNIEIIRKNKEGRKTTIKTQEFVIKDGNTAFIEVFDYGSNVVSNLESSTGDNYFNNIGNKKSLDNRDKTNNNDIKVEIGNNTNKNIKKTRQNRKRK